MPLAIIPTRATSGIKALPLMVEAHISPGLPSFSIVGLPETAVKESKERVRSALMNSNFDFPAKRITINLAPATIPKVGSGFDLPIALGILIASAQLPNSVIEGYEFVGELALSGVLRPLPGILPIVLACQQAQHRLLLPRDNAAEAGLVPLSINYGAENLLQVCAHLLKVKPISQIEAQNIVQEPDYLVDLAEVKGQAHAKRALEISAAGRHSMLMVGPPGTGKTMLASRLTTILPPLTPQAALETAAIRSIHSQLQELTHWRRRPFRAPHHTASAVALVGGGRPPKPGEISLAHHGILFLDELPEFNRQVLETLREPLESGQIIISRAAHQAEFPANFQLIAAMNPCPCGNLGNPNENCRCTPAQIQHYRNRLSAPLLDRIDLHLEVSAIKKNLFYGNNSPEESSAVVRERVVCAQLLQTQRQNKLNHQLNVGDLEHYCALGANESKLFEQAIDNLKLSARSCHRILRIARTVADLTASPRIERPHLTEALSYRGIKYFAN